MFTIVKEVSNGRSDWINESDHVPKIEDWDSVYIVSLVFFMW